jgi:hypothetical protein
MVTVYPHRAEMNTDPAWFGATLIRRRHGLTALRLVSERMAGVVQIFHFEAVINSTSSSRT